MVGAEGTTKICEKVSLQEVFPSRWALAQWRHLDRSDNGRVLLGVISSTIYNVIGLEWRRRATLWGSRKEGLGLSSYCPINFAFSVLSGFIGTPTTPKNQLIYNEQIAIVGEDSISGG